MEIEPAVALVGSKSDGLSFCARADSGDVVLTVRLAQPGLVAERNVVLSSEYGPTLGTLSDFFSRMAKDWRGWKGERSFESVERDLMITASHDGHVRLQVELKDWRAEGWAVRASLTIDAGESLSQAARDVASLKG